MISFDIQIRKDGVYIAQGNEKLKLKEKTVDEIIKKLVSYVCYRDGKEIMIFGDKEKTGL